jgi:hypothetical protein
VIIDNNGTLKRVSLMSHFLLDPLTRLQQELELVDSLGDMSLTASLMAPKKPLKSNVHELNAQLASLDLLSMDVVDSKSAEFASILKYSQDTYNGIGVS